MRPTDRIRLYASALAEPPLPALFALSLVAWVGLAATGHGLSAGHGGGHGATWAGAWLVMLVAMMAPLLAEPLRRLWRSSLSPRRARAVLAFVTAYLAVWMSAGAVLMTAATALHPLAMHGGWVLPGAALAAALLWQASPWKQACLNRCHQAPRLAVFGLAADRDALRYGATKGMWCVGSCWALMALPLVAGAAGLAVMAVVTVVMLAERVRPGRRPMWRVPLPRLAGR